MLLKVHMGCWPWAEVNAEKIGTARLTVTRQGSIGPGRTNANIGPENLHPIYLGTRKIFAESGIQGPDPVRTVVFWLLPRPHVRQRSLALQGALDHIWIPQISHLFIFFYRIWLVHSTSFNLAADFQQFFRHLFCRTSGILMRRRETAPVMAVASRCPFTFQQAKR